MICLIMLNIYPTIYWQAKCIKVKETLCIPCMDMKNVKIYSSGSCDSTRRVGCFFAALEYEGRFKYISGEIDNATADRCILHGFLEALHLIKEPCTLTFVTATHFSFNRLGEPKGANKDLKRLFLRMLDEKQCHFEFEEWYGGGSQLRSQISEIESKAIKVEPSKILEIYGLPASN
jgi:hypothetical protein